MLETANGPLEVRSARPHKGSWLVVFEESHDRDAADALRNVVLLGEPIDDPDELWVHELIKANSRPGRHRPRHPPARTGLRPARTRQRHPVPVQFVVSHPNDEIHGNAPVGLFDLDEAVSERDQD